MSDVRCQKGRRASRHGRLPVGTGRHAATGARAATSGHSHSVAGTGFADHSRVDVGADGATGSRVATYAGRATDTDSGCGVGTGSGVGKGSGVGLGEAGPSVAGPG